MKPKVYGIRNCDTMKKAFAWLEQRSVDYDFHDYKAAGIEKDRLKARGPTWRKIPDAQKVNLNEAREQRAKLLVGFDPAEFDAAF